MSETILYASRASALGHLTLATSERGIVALYFVDPGRSPDAALRARFPDAAPAEDEAALSNLLDRVVALIGDPAIPVGDLRLDLRGSAHALRVWEILRTIPAGATITYGEIARRLGTPREAREVGEACAANEVAILVPCHRVVKIDGSLGGYRWGFWRKRALLKREAVLAARAAA